MLSLSGTRAYWSSSVFHCAIEGPRENGIAHNLYVHRDAPFPNVVYALDLTQPAGPVKWKYEPNTMSSDGRKLYTANGLSNDITVVDTSTNKVIATVKAGDGPWGIAI